VFGLEDAFGISIEDGVIETIKTVGDLVTLVRGKTA
jgi:acyl carrier protein